MKKKIVLIVFALLVIDFLLITGTIFIPGLMDDYVTGTSVIINGGIFLLLGIVLVIATYRQRGLDRRLRRFLILTGYSAAGFFIGVLLHNFLYALAMITHGSKGLFTLFESLHVIFFLISTILCPIGLLVGMIGSIVMFIKKKQ